MLGQTFSHYKILEQLGKGGMGVVYKAEDTNLKRTVALKFIDTIMFDDDESRIRFVKEAQLAASLNHPNISTIYEIDEAESKTFIAMEFLKGQSLKEVIRSGPLSIERTLEIAIQVAGGLQEAHEHNIVHRDIKSSNIMLTPKDQAKVMDFGLAQHSDETRVTRTANVVGTVAYMSPEQAAGKPLDGRTDIWSFGVVIYQMITGLLPFEGGNDQSTLYGILNNDPKPVTGMRSGIPLELEMIINRCLEKDRNARYQTALDLKADLKRLIRNMDSGRLFSTQTMAVLPSKKPLKRSRFVLPLTGVFLILLVAWVVPPVRDQVRKIIGLGSSPQAKYLAILPFSVSEDDPQLKSISTGLVETLTNQITQLESLQGSLQVVPHIDAKEIESAGKAWETLRINLVVAGQMVPVLDKVRLMLSLNSTNPPKQLKSRDIEVSRDEITSLYNMAVLAVVEMLAFEMKPGVDMTLDSQRTSDPDAWVYFIEGLGVLNSTEDDVDFDQAIQLFSLGIEKDPGYALAVVRLGDAHWEKWEQTKDPSWLDQAKLYYAQALKLDEELVPVHYALGFMYRNLGDYQLAENHLLRALELDPSDFLSRRELAYTYEKLGRMEEAETEFKEVIAQKPDYWRGYRYLGVFYFLQGQYIDAEKMFLKLKTLAPRMVDGYDLLAVLYFRQEKYDLAIENLEQALAIKPSYVNFSNLGTIYFFYERDYKKAKEMFQEASNLDRNNYTVKGNLADACRFLGEIENANEYYRQAIQLAEKELKRSKSAKAYSQLGRYHALVGEKSSALASAAQALDLEPQNVEVLLVCAKVYELAGLRQKALETIEEIIRLGGGIGDIEESPDFTELRQDPRYQAFSGSEPKK